jgi:hypothetical protein
LNFGAGNKSVSTYMPEYIQGLNEQWAKSYSLNKLLKKLGAELVDTPDSADYDFSICNLDKDTFIKLFY